MQLLRLLLVLVLAYTTEALASINKGILSPARITRGALGVASKGMGMIKPIFAAEAKLQANVLGDEAAKSAAEAQLEADVAAAPVVVYTYGLSPFSTECIAFLVAPPVLKRWLAILCVL